MNEPALGRRAFTMVELLVVVGIIVVLISIGLVVARSVTSGAKESLTQQTIRVLDTGLQSYFTESATDTAPSMVVNDAGDEFPIIDAVETGEDHLEPSLARFLYATKDVPAIADMVKGLDAKLVSLIEDEDFEQTVTVVVDGWGEPIRFVHPEFDGGHGGYWDADSGNMVDASQRPELKIQPGGGVISRETYRRSYRPFPMVDVNGVSKIPDGMVGDADEGYCPGNRPYFYSGGKDGDPGTRADNVYTTVPDWPVETAEYQ